MMIAWGKIYEFINELRKVEPNILFQVSRVTKDGSKIMSRNINPDELMLLGYNSILNISRRNEKGEPQGNWNMKAQDLFPALSHIKGLINYIIIDLDPEKEESQEDFYKRADKILQRLKSDGWEGIRWIKTGSRGIHGCLKFTGLETMQRYDREDLKEMFLKFYGGEVTKSRENSNISLDIFFNEGDMILNHWKTGKPVELVEKIEGINPASRLVAFSEKFNRKIYKNYNMFVYKVLSKDERA